MSENIYQIYQGNPITTNVSTDLMYFGQSPYGPTNDAAMTYANFASQFLTPTTGVKSLQGTANEVLVNGTSGSAVSGVITLTTPQAIATTSSPMFASLTLTNPLTVGNGGTGIATTPTNGQIPIGNGTTYTAATLSAGPGISIANGSGSVTISGTGSGIGWTEVTGTTQAMVADNGYASSNASLVTLTLPATAAFGTAISIIGKGAGGWLIAQNSGQNIRVGSASSTVGVGGSVASTNRYDSINLICTTADTTWTVTGAPQSSGLTIV